MKTYTSLPQGVILSALSKLEAYVKVTYGPAGKGILIDNGMYQSVVDDGFMAVEEFELENELENAVISYVKEATRKTNQRGGDATTTSILILCALVREALTFKPYELEEKDLSKISEDLEKGLGIAIRQLKKQTIKVSTVEELEEIAFNSYKNREIAHIIAEVVKKVGIEGLISTDDAEDFHTSFEVTMGMSFDKGFVSALMVPDTGTTTLQKPAILITDEDVVRWTDIAPAIKLIGEAGYTSLLLIADTVTGDALSGMLANGIVAVQSPGFGTQRLETLIDIATVTGGQVMSQKLGHPLNSFTVNDIGTAQRVMVEIETTKIIDGGGDTEAIKKRADSIKHHLKLAVLNDKTKLQERISKLIGGAGVIKLGAVTDTEVRSIKMKTEDAIHATRLAYKEGKILGAGLELADVQSGCEILDTALKYPREVLLENGETHLSPKVYDATGVVIIAIESAVSVARSLITTGGIITNKKENGKEL